MKSSSNHNHVKVKNRRPLFTNDKNTAENVDIQHQSRVDLVVQPERKRSRISDQISSNIDGNNSSEINRTNGLVGKSINQCMTITASEKLQECPRAGGSLNVRRKKFNKRTPKSDHDEANCNKKDILDDELLWLSTVNNNDFSGTSKIDNHVIVTGMSSQDSFTDLFASSTTSTPICTPKSSIQNSEVFSSQDDGNLFSHFFYDVDDSKLAELDVSGIISSYKSSQEGLENQKSQSDTCSQMEVEMSRTNSNTVCSTYKLSHAEQYPKIINKPLQRVKGNKHVNTSMHNQVQNLTANESLHAEKDPKVIKQVETNVNDVGTISQNEPDISSKTTGNISEEMKSENQANDRSDELFYGLPSTVGNLIKKHKGIEKLYGRFFEVQILRRNLHAGSSDIHFYCIFKLLYICGNTENLK